MKNLRFSMNLLQAILLFLGFCFIGFVALENLPSPLHLIAAITMVCIGFYFSKMVFTMLNRRTNYNDMASNPSFDHNNPNDFTSTYGIKAKSASELSNLYKQNPELFPKKVNLRIWGDWEGRIVQQQHQLISIENDPVNQHKIHLIFNQNRRLSIHQPRGIYVSTDYVKILTAKNIRWQENETQFYEYEQTEKTIKTFSNTTWHPYEFELHKNMQAVYLQG